MASSHIEWLWWKWMIPHSWVDSRSSQWNRNGKKSRRQPQTFKLGFVWYNRWFEHVAKWLLWTTFSLIQDILNESPKTTYLQRCYSRVRIVFQLHFPSAWFTRFWVREKCLHMLSAAMFPALHHNVHQSMPLSISFFTSVIDALTGTYSSKYTRGFHILF